MGKRRQREVEQREQEVGSDSCYDESSNRHVEVVSDDDNHHDEGYSLGVEGGHDDHSSHQKVGSLHDGMVVENENGNDHCAGPHPESVKAVSVMLLELARRNIHQPRSEQLRL